MARGKAKKKKSSAGLNPDAMVMIRRALLGEGAEMAWRIGTCVVVLALVVAWVMGRGPLQARASEGVDLAQVVLVASDTSTSAVPPEIEQEIIARVQSDVGHDPFDRDSLLRLRAGLARTGWFQTIGQVRRAPDNTIRVEAEWRVARAFVERRGERYLVGDDGAVMDTFGIAGLSGLVTILNPLEGVPRDERGRVAYGTPWGLSDVQDALSIVRALRNAGLDTTVANIDVQDPGRIVIVSLRGAQIVWGSPIDAPEIGEATTGERIDVLRTILTNERNNVPRIWDVRFGRAESVDLIGS